MKTKELMDILACYIFQVEIIPLIQWGFVVAVVFNFCLVFSSKLHPAVPRAYICLGAQGSLLMGFWKPYAMPGIQVLFGCMQDKRLNPCAISQFLSVFVFVFSPTKRLEH